MIEHLLQLLLIDLDPFAAEQRQPSVLASIWRHSASVRASPSSDRATWKSSNYRPRRHSPAARMRTCTCGRGGLRADHQSGTRTTTPASSIRGASVRKR